MQAYMPSAEGSDASGGNVGREGDAALAEGFLRDLVSSDYREEFGISDPALTEEVVRQWMDDDRDAAWRFAELKAFQPGAVRILDMACGCGTAVFWGLKNGLDAYGLDPDSRKHRFMALKARSYGYPREWLSRFCMGVGERLPYADGTFDAVMSYQTLEHVQDPGRVLEELIRVTRAGGCVNLRFPDYRGTFEGHYMLPWLPLFPKRLALVYLRMLGRPALGLKGIQYVTGPGVSRMVRSLAAARPGWRLEIHDGNRARFLGAMKAKGLPACGWLFPAYQGLTHLRCLFRRDVGANLFIKVVGK